MGKDILKFDNIETEKIYLTALRLLVFLNIDLEKAIVSNKISSGKSNYILLVTCIMVIKLSHYI